VSGRVVIADDSRVVRTVLSRELVAAGWEVVEAEDGSQAIDRCREEAPDIILLDIDMPRMNGFQTLAALQREPALAEIPVIFLTGRGSGSDVAEGLRRGAHDYLRKPFEPMELIARLRVARRMKTLQDELRARNEDLERMASTDVLTGLHNRRSAQAVLQEAVERAERDDLSLTALLVDVDHFKQVNDVHGHAAGDDVLRELAQRFDTNLREADVCGRWGGEELLVVLPDTGGEHAAAIAEQLRAEIAAAPFTAAGLPVTVSIGLAEWEGDTADGLVQRADAALYEAKAAGRDAVVRSGEGGIRTLGRG
jgi:two-component system cell cycle response regulator